MNYKKFILYLDSTNKQRFQEKNISKEEQDQIENGFEVQKNNMKNADKKFYIILMKKVNNVRDGNPNIFNRSIYFEAKNKIEAKNKLIYAFKQISIGRSKESLQNIGFLTKENLLFIDKLSGVKKETKRKGK